MLASIRPYIKLSKRLANSSVVQVHKGRQLLQQLPWSLADMGKGRNILIFIHKLHALAHRNLADIQLCDLTLAGFYQFLPPFLEAGGRIGGFLQVNRQADPLAENLFRKGFRFFGS